MTAALSGVARVRVDALRVGDLVLTPSRQWERVTALTGTDRFARSTRVQTDFTGAECPWEWVNRFVVAVRRPAVSVPRAA